MTRQYRSAALKPDQRHSIYPGARSAIDVLAEEIGCDRQRAREVLQGLVNAGFVIAPREPSNPMLDAYMRALGTRPSRHRSVIMNNIGKARKRWQAMALAGTRVALTFNHYPDQSAQAGEAGTAETRSGSVHEHAVPEGDAPEPISTKGDAGPA
jgi:hypothetical protein